MMDKREKENEKDLLALRTRSSWKKSLLRRGTMNDMGITSLCDSL